MINPPMKTSANGRKLIELYEGLYLHTYNDGVGVPTIGYGHTTSAGPPAVHYGMVITVEQADQFLAADLHSVENSVNHYVTAPINQNEFDAFVSFDFNTGALDRSGLLQLVNKGVTDPTSITNAFCAWRYAHVHGALVPILLGRRQRESHIYLHGYPVTRAIAAEPVEPGATS